MLTRLAWRLASGRTALLDWCNASAAKHADATLTALLQQQPRRQWQRVLRQLQDMQEKRQQQQWWQQHKLEMRQLRREHKRLRKVIKQQNQQAAAARAGAAQSRVLTAFLKSYISRASSPLAPGSTADDEMLLGVQQLQSALLIGDDSIAPTVTARTPPSPTHVNHLSVWGWNSVKVASIAAWQADTVATVPQQAIQPLRAPPLPPLPSPPLPSPPLPPPPLSPPPPSPCSNAHDTAGTQAHGLETATADAVAANAVSTAANSTPASDSDSTEPAVRVQHGSPLPVARDNAAASSPHDGIRPPLQSVPFEQMGSPFMPSTAPMTAVCLPQSVSRNSDHAASDESDSDRSTPVSSPTRCETETDAACLSTDAAVLTSTQQPSETPASAAAAAAAAAVTSHASTPHRNVSPAYQEMLQVPRLREARVRARAAWQMAASLKLLEAPAVAAALARCCEAIPAESDAKVQQQAHTVTSLLLWIYKNYNSLIL